ncbi:type II toxin-antitoxin system Phd/YefM family antitoxin [Clostridium bornimense]|uniref:type II toxin-antitoxin system Phd/YefM family antitoxin n=1 Tax=Clostridium bornimense TaxID=1216932 RepID=UPI001C123186|nr:type II toxin-antitoxin system Phd/YefM family antitoxin [Clostridium bornimense]MBU5317908.1 type II toxin-antitoxin system Phd/YefM family antitoxin [Clostridium bornimense]
MSIVMERNNIVSSSDLVKNFAKIRNAVKAGTNMFVFKNNKPDLAILDIDEYEKLLKVIELLENESILKMVEERDKNDSGVRLTTEEIVERRKALRS